MGMDGKNTKLVVFDLNETLVSENTWYELNMAMGMKPEEDEQFMKWYEEGIISYEEGQRFLQKIYLSRGRGTQESMLAAMKYSYRDGAQEIVKYLQDKGYTVALLSGAIDLLVEKVARELNITLYGAHNQLEFDEDGKFKSVKCEGDDSDFKVMMTKKFCADLGIDISETVCVGDSYNDVKLFELSRHGVTFKGTKIEAAAWKVVGELSELKEIL